MCSTTAVSARLAPTPMSPQEPASCLLHSAMFFLCSVYHEELNAPIRRNKEEPKARPLRVGDTEKPEPEREYSRGQHSGGPERTVMLVRQGSAQALATKASDLEPC